jgi:hypothetical protein
MFRKTANDLKTEEDPKPLEDATAAEDKPEPDAPAKAAEKAAKVKTSKAEAAKPRRRKMGTGTGPEFTGPETVTVKSGFAKSKPMRQHSSQNQSRFVTFCPF